MTEQDLIGKTVEEVNVDGYSVEIVFTDGITFLYSASDGGYSSWDVYTPDELE